MVSLGCNQDDHKTERKVKSQGSEKDCSVSLRRKQKTGVEEGKEKKSARSWDEGGEGEVTERGAFTRLEMRR